MTARPWPTEIVVRAGGSALAVAFDTGERFEVPALLLRVMTPSAADRGHQGKAEGLGPLPMDASGVAITDVQPIGRYAVRVTFSDGHDSGLYTWDALFRIGAERETLEAEHRALLGA